MQYSSEKAMLAYAKFLRDIPSLSFDSKNPHFKNEYLSLPGLIEAITPTLLKHNAVLTTGTTVMPELEGVNILEAEFIFVDGTEVHVVKSTMAVPILDNPQHYGSYLTYSRRYLILAALGQAPDKDDDASSVAVTAAPLNKQRKLGGLKRG